MTPKTAWAAAACALFAAAGASSAADVEMYGLVDIGGKFARETG